MNQWKLETDLEKAEGGRDRWLAPENLTLLKANLGISTAALDQFQQKIKKEGRRIIIPRTANTSQRDSLSFLPC